MVRFSVASAVIFQTQAEMYNGQISSGNGN